MPGPAKEYGLILPNKKKESSQLGTRTLNPLANSDDELEKDDEEALNWVEASLKKSAGNSGQKSLQKRLLREALEEDSTVFQYDEVYDDMKVSQQAEQERKKQLIERKPKYIETILKHSEKRKLENERRLERKVQKEREAEGNEFADKESFVTTSYLKKLEELKQAEHDEQREKLMEETLDVHKHKNFGVFYNHIFKQRVGDTEIKQEEGTESSNVTTSTFSKSKGRQKNYRTQENISDDESVKDTRNIEIKKEVVSSNSDEDSHSDEEINKRVTNSDAGRRKDAKDTSKSGGRIGKSNKMSRSRSNDRNAPGKVRRSRSRDRRDNDVEKRRSRSRDRKDDDVEKRRSRSRDRNRRSRSTGRDKKSSTKNRRSRSRDKRYPSVERHKKDKEANGRKRDSERSPQRTDGKEKRRKEGSRERSVDRNKREKHQRGGSTEKHENGNKSRSDKEDKSRTAKDKNDKTKQSINTTLGKTDINKMKVEDRIIRFSEIFAKRTIDKKFEEAVQRYFQRKSEREAA